MNAPTPSPAPTIEAPKKPFASLRPKLRHSLRVTAAALAAFAANHYMHMPQGYWIAFTAMLVVQASVGGSVKAVLERMLGTFAGAAYGAVIASLFQNSATEMFPVVVIAGIAPIAFLAALYPSFRIAPITVAIVLFGERHMAMSPFQYAEHRVIEIGIGCVIGMLVSLTIFPSRAHRAIAKSAGEVLESYAILILQLAEVAAGKMEYTAVEIKHAELRAAINKMETQAEDAKRERLSRLTDAPDPDPLLRMIRRIRFDLVMIGRAVTLPLPPAVGATLLPPFSLVTAQSAGLMRDAAGALARKHAVAVRPPLDVAYAGFAAALSALHRNQALAALNESETGRIFTLSFTLEQLRQNLQDLVARASEFGDLEANVA